MSSSESESDYDYRDKNRRDRDYRDEKVKSKKRSKKNHKDRSRDRKRPSSRDRKKESRRHGGRARSRSRSRSRSGPRSRSLSSDSRKHKNKNKKRDREEPKRKNKESEIESLKEKEIQKRIEMENLRKREEERKKKEEERFLLEQKKQNEKELTEEEKLERKRQARRARVKAWALLESLEEKKREALNIDNVMEDFLEKDKEEEAMQVEEEGAKEKETLVTTSTPTSNVTEIPITKEEGSKEPLSQISFSFNKLHAKMPKLPKEFTASIKVHGGKSEQVSQVQQVSQAPKSKPVEIPKQIKPVEEEEDPIDAFMKTIESQATIQDYELNQLLSNQMLQRRYDEIVEKEEEDNVKMLEEEEEKEKKENKVITLEDILNMNKGEKHLGEEVENEKTLTREDDIEVADDEDFHKQFVDALRKKKAPEFDPVFGYVNTEDERKDAIIYQEDVNEYMNEDAFMDLEEAWQRAKKSGERGKELKRVNHALINYEPFRKSLYIEAKEVSNMTDEQVVNYRKEHGDIKVRGKNIPKPIFNWYHCGLSEKITAVLERKGFKEPFPIQAQATPCIMSGRDVIGIAETGSGKTLAYVLPMLRHVMDQRPLREGEGPLALLMAPTRELATQIYFVVKSFTKVLNLRVSCVYGGAGLGTQVSELRRGAEIVVCTPGRMIEVLTLSNGKITNLQRVTYVVIDEADRMFDMGFEPQLSRILANIRPDRQTVMFSATFPRQIENLAKKILIKPIEIVVGQRGQSCRNVEQHVEVLEENQKFIRLLQILNEYLDYYYEDELTQTRIPIGIIIFVDQQTEADELYKELFNKGYQPLLIHGGQDQEDRNFAIYDFKTGVRNILISTSVCARGLDVKHCGLVVNFKCPNHLEDYVHRVGRTGRAGRKGIAFTFISRDEAHLAEDVLRVLEISEQQIPEELLDLVKYHKEQVESGETDKRRISGFVGRGFEFSSRERDKIASARKELGKGYLMLGEAEEEEVEVKGEEAGQADSLDKEKNKSALALLKPGQLAEREKMEERRNAILKDKRAQQIALDVGANAVKSAIIAGKTEEEALQIAQQAIETFLSEYRPSVSAEKGSEKAAKVIEEWVERENVKNNIFTCELEINEYPAPARNKVMKKDYINSISELSKCTVTLRGMFAEPGKKPPLGQKKLHLYIQGNSKQDVLHAYKEIKHFLDEEALRYYTTGNAYGGRLGKYHI